MSAQVTEPANAAKNKVNTARKKDAEIEIDLAALLFRDLEKIHWILLAALVCAAIAGVYVFKFVTPIYQATSKIYIVGSDTTISLSDLQMAERAGIPFVRITETDNLLTFTQRLTCSAR